MAKSTKAKEKPNLYIGVDVGGTKILAALVEASGAIVARNRLPTPRDCRPEDTLAAIVQAMEDLLAEQTLKPKDIAGIGLTIPGVVDPDEGRVVVTPNMDFSGLEVVSPVEDKFGCPVALGDDVNMGTLGEKWLGAARHARSAVGIFVGTGIGGGVIIDGKLVRGAREAAGEVGHMVMQIGGPLCGCGNRGCFEALASRSAIERDIREAVAAGRESVVTQFLEEGEVLKSKALLRALEAKDPVVTEVMTRASEVLGYACLTVRHLLDPDVIVLGGGVIEACGKFVLPIVQKIVADDALPGARPGACVVGSELGDDAIVLGAVALVQEMSGATPLQDALERVPKYPKITYASFGEVAVGKKVYNADIYIRGDGKVKRRDKKAVKEQYGTSHKIGPEELEKACKGHPELVVIGTGQTGMAALTPEGEAFLHQRGIAVQAETNSRAVKTFNNAEGRKACIIHVKC